jgi:hypothetical protein
MLCDSNDSNDKRHWRKKDKAKATTVAIHHKQ